MDDLLGKRHPIGEREVSAGAFLELDRLSLRYPGATADAVSDMTIEIARGDVVTFLGPSGCGKTSALRMIAGLEKPTAGSVRLDGADITRWPPERRLMGLVFQNYALFPHMTVGENVAFGLKMRRASKPDIAKSVAETLDLVQLTGLDDRRPDQLSGGQQQRVALARALAIRPNVLLLDEPLSNLDAGLREATREALRGLLRELGVTTVFVTHDQSEALAFSDRIVLMRAGSVIECGPPASLYRSPSTRFAAEFLGGTNLLTATAVGDGTHVTIGGDVAIQLALGSWSDGLRDAPPGTPLVVVGRPRDMRFADAPGPNRIAGDVVDDVFLGDVHRVSIRVEGLADSLRIDVRDRPPSGACIVELPAKSLHAVSPEHEG